MAPVIQHQVTRNSNSLHAYDSGLKMTFLVVFSIISMSLVVSRAGEMVVNVTSPSSGSLHHFWASTGLCPAAPPAEAAQFLLSEDSLRNLALVGALPSRAIKYVRVHWLLELVRPATARPDSVHATHDIDHDVDHDVDHDANHNFDPDVEHDIDVDNDSDHDADPNSVRSSRSVSQSSGSSHACRTIHVQFDFTLLDQLLDWMVTQHLTPHVELMGNPAGVFHNLTCPSEARAWRRFVTQLVLHYIERYGVDEVANWRFETWNEPDLRMFNTLHFNSKGFMKYVRASAAGLRGAWSAAGNGRPRPPLMGPAGLFKVSSSHRLCWSLARSCGRHPELCPVDVLSFHKKGNGTFGEGVVFNGANLLSRLYTLFPQLRTFPVANTEADPQVGWARPEPWQVDSRYAADVVRIAVLSHQRLVRGMGVNLLASSNDNAFLSFYPHQFNQRTLLARFQMNWTHPPHTQFFQKPVYAALGMLGLLGEYEIDMLSSAVRSLVLLATVDAADPAQRSYAAIVLASGGPGPASSNSANISLILHGVPSDAVFATWVVDCNTDPGRLWQLENSPAYPRAELRAAMRALQGPRLAFGPSPAPVYDTPGTPLRVSMPSPAAVALVQVCWAEPEEPPSPPSHLRAFNVTAEEVLLLWSDEHISTKCILEYVVEKDGQRISPHALRLLSFQFAPQAATGLTVNGVYTVHARDLWGRVGARSEPLHYADARLL